MSSTNDVTTNDTATPDAEGLYLLAHVGAYLRRVAATYLLSASERDALNRPVDGEPLGSDNRIISAAELASAMSEVAALLAAHAANDGDAKHVSGDVLAALTGLTHPEAAPSSSNLYLTRISGWDQISSAVGWWYYGDSEDGDPYSAINLTPEWIGQVSRNTSTGTIWVGTATAGDAADWSRLETLLSGLTISQITGLADALAAKDTALAAHTDRTDNPHAVTAAQVGLGNCDNTADADKPVSTAQAAAIAVEAARATAAEGVNAAAIAAEAAARLAADLALQASQPSLRAITYTGGFSAFAASAARSGWLDYGGADMIRLLLAGTGVGVLHDMDALRVEMLDPVDDYVRLQVSLTLDTGTLVMRTTSRPMPLVAWRRLGVRVAAPSGGALSSASVAVHIEGETYTLANGGLEVVGTPYTGAPAAGTGAWTLCAASDGSNPLSARIASESWHALNYALSADDYAIWFATGKQPHAGAGTMQALPAATAACDSAVNMAGFSGATLAVQSTIARSDNAIEVTSAAVTYTGFYLRINLPAETTFRVSAWFYIPSGQTFTPELSANNLFTGGGTVNGAITGTVVTDAWFKLTREITTNSVTGLSNYWGCNNTAGILMYVDDIQITEIGDCCAGLDIAAQPVCARTAGGEVLLHSESGVEVVDAPERITLATQLPMTASGYLLGDRLTHPAGYIVDKVLVANTGSASATVTLRAGSSAGAFIATGTVAATSLPVALPISSISSLTAAGGKIYVTGGLATIPLTITVILVRA